MRKKQYKRSQERGLFVWVENNNIEKAISRFKQKIKESDLMLEIRRRSFYQKPSEEKRHIKNLAKLRAKYKKMREN